MWAEERKGCASDDHHNIIDKYETASEQSVHILMCELVISFEMCARMPMGR
mgnify:CR=1 FL=1